MTHAILKYDITAAGITRMPAGAELLATNYQDEREGVSPVRRYRVWARVDVDAKPVERKLYIVPTGRALPNENDRYVGTIFEPNGLVWHIFDGGEVTQ